jgi:single-strand DNA-binding protein
MPSYNRVIFAGHLTRDPQTKHLTGDNSVTEFGLAANRKFKDKEEVCFIDCAAFGKTGETIAKFCQKGRPLLVEGRLKLDQWEKDGQKRSRLSVVVENFQFLGEGKGGQSEPAGVLSGATAVADDDSPF